MKKCISITSGDPNGIGPEITLKTLQQADFRKITPLWHIGRPVYEYYTGVTGIHLPVHFPESPLDLREGVVNVLEPAQSSQLKIQPGKLDREAGNEAMKSVSDAIEYCLNGISDAMVTAPLSKKAISLAGYRVPGHTEYIAEKTGASGVIMMLVSDSLRVVPATIHIPVSQIADSLKRHRLVRTLTMLNHSLTHDFNIIKPVIGVLGLNPHAGDGGVLGREEIEIIEPAIEQARKEGIQAEGPFPADGYFGSSIYQQYDATLAMYHDQGLIPFKTLSFGSGVNYTAGLSIIRTSPDHGTAFQLAGQNRADESSFQKAFDLAITLSENRRS